MKIIELTQPRSKLEQLGSTYMHRNMGSMSLLRRVHVIDNKLNIRKYIGIVEDSFSIIYSCQIAVQICMVLLAIFRF